MRLTWFTLAAAMLGEVVSGCSCKPVPKAPTTGVVNPRPPQAAPQGRDNTQMDAPISYKDAESGIIVYVETDRRHVAAIDPAGRVLWQRDLIVDGPVTFGPHAPSGKKPSVISLRKPTERDVTSMKRSGKSGDCVGVSFNNREWGLIDIRSGDYQSLGRD
ncbi:MAG TPA: hypothetical protein VGF55_31445 [Gemmataceae bacterium]|jgi:hypothetical protein